ncbi:nitrate- and nitrite sensing domain-containing protein [Dactylosporangium sp. NBC_01737]|uniref:sensor histidine kinase n=1 Tax=Dactylosporangium sp. NBC_01737 TaxID=2975959 RepID=UPI002E0E4D34|nr:nitrate- and nitrite sensing domain-containing protein [Dactylosporangium sp. NBC_01737]
MPASKKPAGSRLRIGRPRLANTRIRAKLGLILLIPIVAIVTLAAFRLDSAADRASDAVRVGALTRLSAGVSALSQQIHLERMAAAVLLSSPTPALEAFNRQILRTDQAIAAYAKRRDSLGDVPTAIRDRLQRIDDQLEAVATIRAEVSSRQGVSVAEVLLRYGVIVEDLVSYREALGQVSTDPDLADGLRAAAAFSKAKARLAEQEAIVYAALKAGPLDAHQFSALLATLTGQQEAFVAFSLSANVEQRRIVEATIAGDATQMADDMTSTLQRSVGQPSPVTADDAVSVFGAVNDLMRWTEERLDDGLIADAAGISSAVRRQVIVESAIVVLVLAVVLGLALVTARSMVVSLRRLRQSALAVAEHDLPAAVSQFRDVQTLQERSPQELADQVRDPIGFHSKDEIGEVARAFNIVHREAVRVAAEQAVLRNSVSAMFLNLARRSQTLVDRMIGQLDRIERGEEDPKRLADLFQLDHLATRMRRNDENVLVLAGADTTPPRRQNAPLIDVMRAAQSEIELYERIEFPAVDDDIFVAAPAVNDTVRLLAELLDNATRFSPPNAPVLLTGRRLGDRAILQIEDRGLGIDPESLAAYNGRLAQPPPVDIGAFRLMGIAVVGRLAFRHRIIVQLRNNAGGGTVAEIVLPHGVLVLPRDRRAPAIPVRRRTAALPTQTQPVAFGAAPGGTATMVEPGRGQPPAWPLPMPATEPAPSRWADLVSPPPQPVWNAVMAGEDTTELPIFREIETAWFHERGHSVMQGPPAPARPVAPPSGVPSSPPPSVVPSSPHAGAPSVVPSSAHAGAPSAVPSASQAGAPVRADWRSVADDGWRAASAAQHPPLAGSTRSGLPKRAPQAQLVPGGVPTRPTKLNRPSAEELRGLLSSYQRGVQRGRQAGGSNPNQAAPATEENR